MTDAIDRRLNSLCITDDTIWKGLTTAPTGIAVFSQLMISTTQVTDFRIDKIDKTHIPLMKHPESFRRTLMQIADEVYGAFDKAQTNMEMIQSQVAQVPGYVIDCVRIIQSENKIAINQNLPRLLENIKKIADNCLKMSTEVAQAFDRLGKLNRQVLLAIVARHGAKEQEIKAVIKARIYQEMESRPNNYLLFIRSLENMHVDVEKEISRNEIINLLGDGLSKLSQFYTNYAGLIKNFDSINNHIEQVTHRALTDFVDDAKIAQEDPFIIDFMTDSINKSLELSDATHRTAKMYVEFSNKNIMKSLKDMHQSKNALYPF
jgi:NTP pyrophosphatase (non-canonical NTP hydrolase)